MAIERDYVLGTHDAELARLGLQHDVWRPRAAAAWRRAGFTVGQTLLDLGCGPGHATLDLAGIVGPTGRVLAVDRSRRFLDALEVAARARGLGWIETRELDLDRDALPDARLDGAWARWVFSFGREPQARLGRVAGALRPGGVLVLHEYVDYRAWRLSPRSRPFEEFVGEVMTSWRASGGEPDVALDLPRWLESLGFDVRAARPITELARAGDFVWQWPKAFFEIGLQRLVDLGAVDPERADAMRRAFDEAERTSGAFMLTPTVLEIVARRR